MDPQPNENFFELKLSQEGTARILRLFRLVRWLFLTVMLCSFLFVGYSFLRLFTIDRYEAIPDWQFQAEIVASPVYSIVVTILLIVQAHSYFHFTRLCKKAIELQQTDLFNYSFKWLVRHAQISLIILITEFLMGCFSLYVAIHLLQKYPTP